MAAPVVGNVICVRGTLTFNGTLMGLLRDMVFEPRAAKRMIHAEEWAVNTDGVYIGEKPIFKGVLRYPDSDAIANIIPAGAFSFAYNQTFRPGSLLSTKAGVMLFTPTYSGHPAVKFYNAIPMIDEAAQLQHSMGEEWGLAVVFEGTPDGSGRVYADGPVGGLP